MISGVKGREGRKSSSFGKEKGAQQCPVHRRRLHPSICTKLSRGKKERRKRGGGGGNGICGFGKCSFLRRKENSNAYLGHPKESQGGNEPQKS